MFNTNRKRRTLFTKYQTAKYCRISRPLDLFMWINCCNEMVKDDVENKLRLISFAVIWTLDSLPHFSHILVFVTFGWHFRFIFRPDSFLSMPATNHASKWVCVQMCGCVCVCVCFHHSFYFCFVQSIKMKNGLHTIRPMIMSRFPPTVFTQR